MKRIYSPVDNPDWKWKPTKEVFFYHGRVLDGESTFYINKKRDKRFWIADVKVFLLEPERDVFDKDGKKVDISGINGFACLAFDVLGKGFMIQNWGFYRDIIGLNPTDNGSMAAYFNGKWFLKEKRDSLEIESIPDENPDRVVITMRGKEGKYIQVVRK